MRQLFYPFLAITAGLGFTLLTVGYGDIVPKGDFRFTAVAEVYGGTLFIFSFFAFGLSVLSDRHFKK